MMESLTVSRHLYDEAIAHLQAAYPLEACGLLAGLDGCARRVYAVENKLHSPAAFEMEPLQQLQAMLDYEEAGLQLLAIYHSHPGGPETPSPVDIAQVFYPDAAHLIVSLRDRRRPVARAFTIDDGQFHEIDLIIV